MKVSEPLSPAARRVLELGSIVDPPTAQQCERMDRALAPLFGAGRTSPLADSPARAGAERFAGTDDLALPRDKVRAMQRSMQHKLALGGTKLALALGALTATAGVSFWLGRAWTPPDEPRAMVASFRPTDPVSLSGSEAAAPDVVAPPARLIPSWARDTPVVETESAPARDTPVVDAAGASGVADAPASTSARAVAPSGGQRGGLATAHPATGLAAEIERMARVEAALRQGRPARALEYLAQGRIEHLVEQAAALRAVARCESGLESAALTAGDVLRRWPTSPFQSRIRDACGL